MRTLKCLFFFSIFILASVILPNNVQGATERGSCVNEVGNGGSSCTCKCGRGTVIEAQNDCNGQPNIPQCILASCMCDIPDPEPEGPGHGFDPDTMNEPCYVNGVGGVPTAFGCIPVEEPSGLAAFLIRIGSGVGGGVTILMIAYASFMIMTSGGDPGKLQSGKALLTAAVAGLLFLIFGVYALELIGVQILGIPGLT